MSTVELRASATRSRLFLEALRRAQIGDCEAQFVVGRSYLHGDGAPQHDRLAYTWLRRAASSGHARALTRLGDCYFYGYGTSKNTVRAKAAYAAAWERGDVHGGHGLALCLWRQRAWTDAVALLGKLVRRTYLQKPEALLLLSAAYAQGRGVEASERKALKCVKRAAALGDEQGLNDLGWYYLEGVQVRKDLRRAELLFRQAAAAMHTSAMYNLALVLSDPASPGGQRRSEARTWLRRAAKRGHRGAKRLLGRVRGDRSR